MFFRKKQKLSIEDLCSAVIDTATSKEMIYNMTIALEMTTDKIILETMILMLFLAKYEVVSIIANIGTAALVSFDKLFTHSIYAFCSRERVNLTECLLDRFSMYQNIFLGRVVPEETKAECLAQYFMVNADVRYDKQYEINIIEVVSFSARFFGDMMQSIKKRADIVCAV